MQISEIQAKIHANQTARLEQDAAIRAASVIAKARRELLRKSRGEPSQALARLDSVLAGLDNQVYKALRAQGLIEDGFVQSQPLVQELAIGTQVQTAVEAFTPVLDVFMLAQETSEAANKIRGIEQTLKDQMRSQIQEGLAAGEGTADLMNRLFSMDPGAGHFAKPNSRQNGEPGRFPMTW